jgi:hypothetical protein
MNEKASRDSQDRSFSTFYRGLTFDWVNPRGVFGKCVSGTYSCF